MKTTLLAAACLGGLAVYAGLVERTRVSLDRFTVAVARPGLPPGGLTILHLSDLHCRAHERVQTRKLARLRRLLAGEKYDILAFTGDLIHNSAGLPTALAFLAELRPRLGAFAVPGNRDYWESGFGALLGAAEERARRPLGTQLALAARRAALTARRALRNERFSLHVRGNDVSAMLAALAAQGVQPLLNRAQPLGPGGGALWVAGVDDLAQGQPDLAAALADVPSGAPLILLSHNPDIWLDPSDRHADLTLAGHTHGGQLRLPLIGALYRQGTRLPRHQPAGWFEQGGARLFVSRGLGESFPWRFGAPLQAALIHLTPGGES